MELAVIVFIRPVPVVPAAVVEDTMEVEPVVMVPTQRLAAVEVEALPTSEE